jgi:hypothetical protein
MSRLTWRRDPAGGYIAYPEGDRLPGRRAEIRYEPTSSTKWRWLTFYEGAVNSGVEATKQLAADRATDQWPVTKRNGLVKVAEDAEQAVLRTNVQRMMSKGDLPLSLFAIETAPTERLHSIIWLVRDAGGLEGPAKPLVEACSKELYRRRTAQPMGTTTDGSGGPVRT